MKTILPLLWLAVALPLVAQTPPVPSRPVRTTTSTNLPPPGPGPASAPPAVRTVPPRFPVATNNSSPAAPSFPPGVVRPAASAPPIVPPLPRPVVPSNQQPPAPPTPATPTVVAPGAPPAVPSVNASVAPGAGADASGVASTNTDDSGVIKAGTIKFQAMPIEQALDFYADLVGRTVLRPASLPQAVITLKTQNDLTYKEAIEALDSVFSLNGISTVLVGEKFVTVVPTAQVQQEAGIFSTNKTDTLPEAGQYTPRIVQLKYLRPSEVVPAIQPFAKVANSILPVDANGILILRDNAANIKRMLEIIEKLDVALPLEEELEVVPIKYALASEIAGVLGSLAGTGGGGVVASSGGTSRSPSARGMSTGSYGGRSLGVGGPGGVGSVGGTPLGSVNPTTPGAVAGTPGMTSASAATSSFADRLKTLVNRASSPTGGAASGSAPLFGQARIIPDERTNSLLLYGTKEDRAQVRKVIEQLDVVQAQVLIEAIILEVSLGDSFKLGISAGQSQRKSFGDGRTGFGGFNNGNFFTSTNGVSANALTPGGFSYFVQGASWDTALTALSEDSSVNVLSRPRIQTSHAVEASLFIGQTVPYVTGTYFGYGTDGRGSSQYQQTQVGITLNVLPLINVDGLVVMDISQNIEQLGKPTQIDGNDVPTTTKRQASAKVAVQDGETIILGGFISSSRTQTKSGVPYLKDIPGLGVLFRSKNDKNDRTELIVLMRPTVLKTPQAASVFAGNERERMAGVQRAELELRAEEDSLSAKNRQIIEQRRREEAKKGTLREPLYYVPTVPQEMLKPGTNAAPKPAPGPARKPSAPEPQDTAEPPTPGTAKP